MVFTMKEHNQSTPLRRHTPRIETDFFKTSMKAKDRLNNLRLTPHPNRSNMGNFTCTSRISDIYESVINNYTSFKRSNFQVPKMNSPKPKIETLLSESSDDVLFLGEKSALPIEERKIPIISDVMRKACFILPRSILKYSGFEVKTDKSDLSVDRWNIDDITDQSKRISKQLRDQRENFVETLKKPSSSDNPVLYRQYNNKIESQDIKLHLKPNYFDSLKSTLDCSPRYIQKSLPFLPLYEKIPEIEDVPLLRPKITYKIPELTDDMKDVIRQAFQKQIIRDNPYRLVPHDLQTLSGQAWLNDTIIDAYMMLIEKRGKANGLNIRCFTTFLFTRLLSGGVNDRFMKKEDFLNYDLIMLPINHSKHWRLMTIDVRKKLICYYDSLNWTLDGAYELMLNFLASRSIRQRNEVINLDEWSYNCDFTDIPRQENCYDCGVFALKYADCISRNMPFFFSQKDIPIIRQIMSYELITATLL